MADIILAVLLFLPWIHIGVYRDIVDLPVLDLASGSSNLADLLSGFGSQGSEASGWFAFASIALVVLWLVGLAGCIVDIVNRIKGKQRLWGLACCGVTGLVFIVLTFAVNAILVSELNSMMGSLVGNYIPSSIVSATLWLWAFTVISIVAIFLHVKFK